MPRIDTISLRSMDPERLKQFYIEVLGMHLRVDGAVAYGDGEAGLMFEQAARAYQPATSDLYWKVALAVPDIEQAHAQLTSAGVAVSPPRQFQDVGYLAHFQDPEGFAIELIEHWFEGNRPAGTVDRGNPGGGATLNLLTLRTHDIAPIRRDCLAWGMTPLSVQPVETHGFVLHFFAFTDERPPNPELTAVENREWLYQRPYTVLEIQEVVGADVMNGTAEGAAGYVGALVSGVDQPFRSDALGIIGRSDVRPD